MIARSSVQGAGPKVTRGGAFRLVKPSVTGGMPENHIGALAG
jgi:hypothetical protein